jgi:signal transduction histidine kinase
MFRSIRWRLVASYTLMTILSVTLVGVLALFLIERYLVRQERDYLAMGATTVAQQIEPMLRAPIPQPALQDLVRTTALLSDVQVRILNDKEQLLADSGQPSQLDAVTWSLALSEGDLLPPAAMGVADQSGVFLQFLPEHQSERPAVIWHKAPMTAADMRHSVPPIVVFRRGTYLGGALEQPALPPHEELHWVQPAGDSSATAPITAPFIEIEGKAGQRWFGVGSLFTPALPIPQRVIQTVSNDGEIVGYVELSSDLDFGVTALALIRRAFLLAGVGVSLLALLVALWMSHSLTAPLQALIVATNQMRSGALSSRAAVRRRDEIGLLATQFNTMAAKLESSFAELAAERDALRRFVADASHELRTPITALKTFGELLQGPAGTEPTTRAEFLQESQKQLQRLEWITSALLKLSRLDAGLLDLPSAALDGCALVRTAARPFVERAQEKQIALEIVCPDEPALLWGNGQYLELALVNLLDNALTFTPSGGKVRIGVTQEDQEVALWVQDNGVGIAAADQPYIFDRFYRGLHHNFPATAEGSGLGLAIVQSIVKAHAGRITLTSTVGEGSHFAIWLPAGSKTPGGSF